jgi:aspartate aminotransferase
MLSPLPPVSKRLHSVGESGTTRIFTLAQTLRRQGRDIISLAVGEPDFDTPAPVVAATRRALAGQKTRYGAVAGIEPLRNRLAGAFQGYGPANVIITNGAKQGLYSLFQVLLNPGDEVILSKPCWVSFTEQIKLAGGVPALVKTRDHQLDPVAVRQAVTDRTKAILINSPNNPTGAVYSREEIEAVLRIAETCGCWLIADEAYHTFAYPPATHVRAFDLSASPERIITVRSFSKHYMMTGFRLGYVAGPEGVIKAMADLQSHLCGNVCSFAQYGALAALEMDQSFVEHYRSALHRRRDIAFECSERLFDCVQPAGAFYLFPNIENVLGAAESSEAFALRLLRESGVAVVPGEAFGKPGHIRISFGIAEAQLRAAFERIERLL